MSQVVIKVEGVSKQYRLGQIGTGSLAHDINRWWYKIRRKEDPYLKIGETNDRTQKSDTGYVWSLRDINLEVKEGDVVGLIGKNGAGKSTLLKVLSRTTAPTTGSIKIKGRVASLLEVGTGFHPELTGRENIFLNGAILGMTRAEIKRKFDEIVEFAGVEKYVDTPVKRYSSGMYVRLAFGVAAHLEPEILIVDEVLAVGDAEFQKKALGKMKDVSDKDGRTVLFVSHNMTAINSICKSGIILKNGQVEFSGPVDKVVDKYLDIFSSINYATTSFEELVEGDGINIHSVKLVDVNNSGLFTNNQEIKVRVCFEVVIECKPRVVLTLLDDFENILLSNSNYYNYDDALKPGYYETEFIIPCNMLNTGQYNISLRVDLPKNRILVKEMVYVSFGIDLLVKENFGEISEGMKEPHGIFHPILPVATKSVEKFS